VHTFFNKAIPKQRKNKPTALSARAFARLALQSSNDLVFPEVLFTLFTNAQLGTLGKRVAFLNAK
jgi:hypothetical protein